MGWPRESFTSLNPSRSRQRTAETASVPLRPGEGGFELLVEIAAIDEAGQPIVVGQIGDLRLRLAPLGNVLVGGHPAAVRHGLMCHGDRARILEVLHEADEGFVSAKAALPGVDFPEMGAGAEIDQIGEQHSRHGGEIERKQLGKALVVDHQLFRRVHHAQGLRHVVERGVEPLVLRAEFAVATLQDLVARVQFGIDRLDFGMGELEIGRGPPEILGQRIEVGACAFEKLVVPAQQADQEEAAEQQPGHHDREGPVQPKQFGLVLRHLVAAVGVRGRRDVGELAVQRREDLESPDDGTRAVQLTDQGLDLLDGSRQKLDRRQDLAIMGCEILEFTMVDEFEAVGQNIQPELNLVAVDFRTWNAGSGDPLLQPYEFRAGLTGQPGYVVARNATEGIMALGGQRGNVNGGNG